jgi:hypothetical protein
MGRRRSALLLGILCIAAPLLGEDRSLFWRHALPLADIPGAGEEDRGGSAPGSWRRGPRASELTGPNCTASAGSIVLIDGTLRSAQFAGLNLGVVYTDGGEIDREEVAAFTLARPLRVPPRPTALKRDVLILADGAKRAGRLATCTAASCTFESQLVPLANIRWIGMKREGTEPPAASAAEDLIFIKDKPPVTARMSSIDATTVRTTRGTFARNDVTWIHVAAPPHETPTPKGAQKAAERETPPPAPPPSPKNTPPPSGTKPPTTQGPRSGDLAEGDLWTGTVHGERTLTYAAKGGSPAAVHHYTTHFEVRLREHNKRPIEGNEQKMPHARRTVGWMLDLWNEGTRVEAAYEGPICSDRAVTTYSGDRYSLSHIWWRTIADDDLKSIFPISVLFDMKLEDVPMDGVYKLIMGTCCWDPCGRYPQADYGLQNDPVAIGFASAVNSEYEMSLVPPRYHHLNAAHTRMTGSFDVTKPFNDPSSGSDHLKVCWDICKQGSGSCGAGCGATGPGGPTPPPAQTNKPCPEVDPLIKALKALKDQFDQTNRDHQKAVEQRDAIRDEIFGLDGAARKFFTSMLGLAGKGAKGLLSKAISVSKTLMNMSPKGNTDDVVKATSAIAPDILKSAAQAAAVSAAVAKADAFLEATGDDAGALRTYADSITKSDALAGAGKSAATAISVTTGMVDYGTKASKLIDLMNKWSDFNSDATRFQKEMDDINRRMDELNKRIKEARDRCAQRSSSLPRNGLVEPVRYVFAEQAAGASDPRGIAARLQQATEQLARVNGELEAAAPWLLPFMVRTTKPISTRLAADLLGKAVPHLEAVQNAIDDTLASAKSIESELPKAIPDATRSSSPPPKVGGETRTSRSRDVLRMMAMGTADPPTMSESPQSGVSGSHPAYDG